MRTKIITDDDSPLSSICSKDADHGVFTFPTDAKVQQKKRFAKMKEAGIKPKKKKHAVEPGNDDCGDDLSGLGADIALYGYDLYK